MRTLFSLTAGSLWLSVACSWLFRCVTASNSESDGLQANALAYNVTLFPTSAPQGNWQALAGSSTGQNLVATARGNEYSYPYYFTTVYVSKDYGATWTDAPLSSLVTPSSGAYISSDKTGCIIFGGTQYSNAFGSINCGRTWYSYENMRFYVAILDESGKYGFAVSTSGQVLVSSTYGYTWTEKSYYFRNYGIQSVTIGVNGTYLASAVCSGTYVEVYTAASIDSSWASQNWRTAYNCDGAYLAADSIGTTIFLVVGTSIYKSTNGGNSWLLWNKSPPGGLIYTYVSCDSLCQRVILTGHTYKSSRAVQYVSNNYGASWKQVYFNNTNETLLVTSYHTVISDNGTFVASIPIASSPIATYPGSLFVNCNEYLNITGSAISSSATMTYTFSNVGYVCDSFYLSPSLTMISSSASAGELILTITAGNNGNEYDGQVLFAGSCGIFNASITRRCALNIQINNTIISPAGGGSFSLVSDVASVDAATVGDATSEFTYQLDYLMTVLPVPITVVTPSTPEFYYDPSTLLVVFFVTAIFLFCGYVIGQMRRQLYEESLFISVLRFGLFGFLFSTELWLLGVMQWNFETSVKYFIYLADILVALRFASTAPGAMVLVKILAPPYISGSKYYQELLTSNGDDKKSSLVTGILSVGVLFDPQLVVYFPWKRKTASTLIASGADNHMQSLIENKPADSLGGHGSHVHANGSDGVIDANRGYPDVIMMDLCTMYCGLIATTIVISQVVCYCGALTSNSTNDWTGGNLLLRIVLFMYAAGHLMSNVPTFAILYGHLMESLSQARSQRRFGIVVFMKWCWNYVGAYDYSIRWERMKMKWAAGTAIPFRLVFSILMTIATLGLYGAMGQQCRMISCWTGSMFSVLLVTVAVDLFIEIYITLEYDEEYNAHLELLEIAASFSLDAGKITRLLKFTVVGQSIAEVAILFLLVGMADEIFAPFVDGYTNYKPDENQIIALLVLAALKLLFPVIEWAIHRYRVTGGDLQEALYACLRLNIFLMHYFLKGMVCWICPLALLSNISILKSQHGWFSAGSGAGADRPSIENSENPESGKSDTDPRASHDLLSFQLRDNWQQVDKNMFTNDDGEEKRSWYVQFTKSCFVILDRLSKRFTVVYSFVKLCGTIAFTLFINTNYLMCGDPQKIHSSVTCDVSYSWDSDASSSQWPSHSSPCNAVCVSSSYRPEVSYPEITGPYPPFPPTPWTCTATLPNACICNDWFIFQFTIIVFHVIHYVVQCYFYIRYNYFDPQQNQINCVETYSFAGQNLTLFLTQPSMCLLSVVEAACIIIVWVQLLTKPGVYCHKTFQYSDFDLYFAVFITVIEVYKANISTCGKLMNRREYWWALWSLFRLDLFIFYGFTLFLQTFFFPFSLVGYLWSGRKFAKGRQTLSLNNADGEECDKLDAPLLIPTAEAAPTYYYADGVANLDMRLSGSYRIDLEPTNED
jgi:hypothetical protein